MSKIIFALSSVTFALLSHQGPLHARLLKRAANGMGGGAIQARAGGERVITVMRHASRVDVEMPAEWEGSLDAVNRPFDPPIADYLIGEASDYHKIAEQRGLELQQRLPHIEYNMIVTSPFKRCLQTAGVMAAVHGIRAVHVRKDLGEIMNKPEITKEENGKKKFLNADGQLHQYLTLEQMTAEVGRYALEADIEVTEERNDDFVPSAPESPDAYYHRIGQSFAKISQRLPGQNVLVVTHGDAINASVSSPRGFYGQNVGIGSDYAAWVSFRDFNGELVGRSEGTHIIYDLNDNKVPAAAFPEREEVAPAQAAQDVAAAPRQIEGGNAAAQAENASLGNGALSPEAEAEVQRLIEVYHQQHTEATIRRVYLEQNRAVNRASEVLMEMGATIPDPESPAGGAAAHVEGGAEEQAEDAFPARAEVAPAHAEDASLGNSNSKRHREKNQ